MLIKSSNILHPFVVQSSTATQPNLPLPTTSLPLITIQQVPTRLDLDPMLPSPAANRITGTHVHPSSNMIYQNANGHSDWRIAAPTLVPTFPHPRNYIVRDPYNEPDLRFAFGTAPCLDPVGFEHEALLANYEYD